LFPSDVNAKVDGKFKPAIAGTDNNPDGVNGSYTFTVTLSKGAGTPQTTNTLMLIITATPYEANQDDVDIAEAKQLLESELYDLEAQDILTTEDEVKSYVQGIIDALLLPSGVNATVIGIFFESATAGTDENPDGENGSYTFTVTLSKGEGTPQITNELKLIITATPIIE